MTEEVKINYIWAGTLLIGCMNSSYVRGYFANYAYSTLPYFCWSISHQKSKTLQIRSEFSFFDYFLIKAAVSFELGSEVATVFFASIE